MLRFNYSIRAHEFLNDPEQAQKLRWMKEAHVSTVWIDGYFFGHYDSTWEEMVQVKQLLKQRDLKHRLSLSRLDIPVIPWIRMTRP